MISHKYTKEENNFLKENYKNLGMEECCKILKKTHGQIKGKIYRMKLTLTSEKFLNIKRESQKKIKYPPPTINVEQFLDIKTPEVAYILGLLWADGHVQQKDKHNVVSISCQIEDFKIFEKILKKIGDWRIYYFPPRKKTWKATGWACTHNKPLVNFLLDNDYKAKSWSSADKIIEKIPENLKHYWFRGLVDGDGCFYVRKQWWGGSLSISSSYNQNWLYMENLCKKLDIHFRINKVVNGEKYNHSKASHFIIDRKNDIIRFGEYIYKNFKIDHIGLFRKFTKFQHIKLGEHI